MCLPHDWLTWQLGGGPGGREPGANALATDRGDASGTGYFSPATGEYRLDLLERAFGRVAELPRILAPAQPAGRHARRPDARMRDRGQRRRGARRPRAPRVTSSCRSGPRERYSRSATTRSADPTGMIAGFADATGRFLPLVCTLNAARVLPGDGAPARRRPARALLARPRRRRRAPTASSSSRTSRENGRRTGRSPPGAVHGLRLETSTPGTSRPRRGRGRAVRSRRRARRPARQDVRVERVILIGGASRSEAVRRIAPGILGRPVVVPAAAQHVAIGAARQAAWALSGDDDPPAGPPAGARLTKRSRSTSSGPATRRSAR